VDELVRYGSAITGAPFTVLAVTWHWHPPREAGRRLRNLRSAAIQMTNTRAAIGHTLQRPARICRRDVARGPEQQLIEILVGCL
jgi:hypothetical protein